MRLRSFVVASLVGCSLVDPLDDISGGPAKRNLTGDGGAIASVAADDGGGDAAPSDAAATTGPDPNCPDEGEPNAPTPRQLDFKTATFCGTVTADDTDMFVMEVPADAGFQVMIDLPDTGTITAEVSGNGSNSTSTSSTSLQRNGGTGGPLHFVFSTGEATRQKYVISLMRS